MPAPEALAIRLLEASDAQAVVDFSVANRTRLHAGALVNFPQYIDEHARWIGAQAGSLDDGIGGRLIQGVFASDRLVGIVGIDRLQRFHGAGIWYVVSQDCQGRGIAKTAVLQAMTAYCVALRERGQKLPPRWVLHALPANARSLQLAESLGFERDDMLDYTRASSRGAGRRLLGHVLECAHAELEARLQARRMSAVAGAIRPASRTSAGRRVVRPGA